MVPYNVQNDFSLQCRPSVSKILIIIFEYTRLLQKMVCFAGFWITALEILALERNKQKNDPIFIFL